MSGQLAFGRTILSRGLGMAGLLAVACGDSQGAASREAEITEEALAQRAYVISEESNDLFVVDLSNMTKVGQIDSSVAGGANANHMSMLSRDGSKLYITAAAQNALVVVDTRTLAVTRRIDLGSRPTHAEACFDCAPDGRDELWVVNEGGGGPALQGESGRGQGSVSVIDMATDEVVRSIADPSFNVPHFVRFHERAAYIPSIGGNQISVLDLDTQRVTDVLLLEGQTEPGPCSADPCGFADAQIDKSGLLVAAHIESGRVLSFDTNRLLRRPDLKMGNRPWSIFVDQLSDEFDTHLMPNWGDETVSVIDRREQREVARSLEGDQESYGINYSPLAPGQAFVLNRVKERVAVIDRTTGSLLEALDVGGTTETASTTRDGRYLLLPISSTNQFAVLDVTTRTEVARFDDVGIYPWSVTTVGGQNYCH
ncbi:MAG TPA: YncE family protein [Polyangiaceae bacterium]|nr:YncE family protein [Polyangiaceae bacterium]